MRNRDIKRSLMKRIFLLFIFLSIPALLGALGFAVFEGSDLFDALYSTVCLLTTASYAPIDPATMEGKILTMLLSLFGISFIVLAVTTLSAPILEKNINRLLEEERERLERMEISEMHVGEKK